MVLILLMISGPVLHARSMRINPEPVMVAGIAGDLQHNLETAFWKAFTDPGEFRASEIFQLLGYNAAEIAQIGKITPMPAKISVEAEKNGQPDGFNNIRVTCHNVYYYNMTIERVVFDFPACRLNLDELSCGRLRFVSGDCIRLKTEVSQSDILKVFDLYARAKALTGLKMKLEKDRATLVGRIKKGFIVAEFNLRGNTELVDSKTVMFRCQRLTLNGSPMPRNAIAGIFAQINPVFDASKTWLNLNVASINIRPGFVETIATIDRKKG